MSVGRKPVSIPGPVANKGKRKATAALNADTITDEQIEALRLESSEDGSGVTIADDYMSAAVMLNMCDEALGAADYGDKFTHLPMAKALAIVEERRQWSRARCAEILNSRALDRNAKETP